MIKTLRVTFSLSVVGALMLASLSAPAAPAATCVPAVSAPGVGTGPATAVSANGATLGGSVDPKGCATTYHFQYGLTTAYGAATGTASAGSGTSVVSVTQPVTGLAPNTVYHYRIVATSPAGTSSGSDGTFTTSPACVGAVALPGVGTGAATGVGAQGATLGGAVDPKGCATTYHFQYGLTTSYGGVTAARSAGSGTGVVSVTQPLTGLVPRTVYHYRIVATSSAGTSVGSDRTFTTSVLCVGAAALPGVGTGAATAVSSHGATLGGAVDPKGCATTYHFQYGPPAAYGRVTTTRSTGSGRSVVSVTQPVTGLAPNTVYHYRIVATSSAGTSVGADRTFRTSVLCVGTGARPAVATGAAAGVGAHGTTLGGSVNPKGCATVYHFQYGLTTAYGTVTATRSAGSGTSLVSATQPVTGLAANTAYHYRIVATSSAGTVVGRDVTFRTAAAPPALSLVRILGTRESVRRGFVARITLRCLGTRRRCQGTVKVFRARRLIGSRHFSLAAGSTTIINVRLNARGRRLMRQHRRLPVNVVARSTDNTAQKTTTLIRRFPLS